MLYRIALIGCLLLTSITCFADRVQYDMIFDATWSPETHPGFPANGHFSGVYGATHNSDFTFWQRGDLASPGIQQIAELGTNTIAKTEVAAAVAAGNALTEVGASGQPLAPYTVTGRFSTFSPFPQVSVVTMIAPSPDWFVGVSSLDLKDENGNWIPEITVDAYPYDSGTDSGTEFVSANLVTDPFEPIFRIEDAPFEDLPPLGSFTFRLLSLPGDVNGSGEIGVDDFDTLCFRLGQSHPNIDQAGNPDLIELEDVHAIAERILGTSVGDTNLDGRVGFEDFLTLSANFGQSANWAGGDFDCNRQIEFADFLALSANFGFQAESASLAAVPEPATVGLFCLGLITVLRVSRRRRD